MTSYAARRRRLLVWLTGLLTAALACTLAGGAVLSRSVPLLIAGVALGTAGITIAAVLVWLECRGPRAE